MSGGGVEVFVRGADGEAYALTVGEHDTLSDVKGKVVEALSMGSEMKRRLSLVHMGEDVELEEGDLYSGLGVAGGDEISLVLRDDPDYKNPRRQFRKAVGTFGKNIKFCVTGFDSYLPAPSLRIGGDLLGWPLPRVQKDELLRLPECTKVAEGRYVISADAMKFENSDWVSVLNVLVTSECKKMGVEGKVRGSLREMVISEEGAAERDLGMKPSGLVFGTFVVVMPSTHEGGDISVKYDGKEERLVSGGEDSEGLVSPLIAAFYGACRATVGKVSSGHKVELVYELVYEGKGAAPYLATEESVLHRLLELERLWVAKDEGTPFVGHFLNRYYSYPSWDSLQGRDLALAESLVKSELYDVCLVSTLYTSLDTGYSVEHAEFEEFLGRPAFPPGTEFTEELEAAVIMKDLEPKFFSEVKYFQNQNNDESSCEDSFQGTITLKYFRSALVVWPKRLRYKFLGAGILLQPLRRMLADGAIPPDNILGSPDIESFFTLCVKSSRWEDYTDLTHDIFTLASHALISDRSAALVLDTMMLRRVQPRALHEALRLLLLNRGDEVKTAFVNMIRRGCTSTEGSATAINILSYLCGINLAAETDDDDTIPMYSDVELLKKALGVFIETLEMKVEPSSCVVHLHIEAVTTVIHVLKAVEKLGMGRALVFENICKNTERFYPLVLVEISEVGVSEEEAALMCGTMVGSLNDVYAELSFLSLVTMLRLVARSGKAREMLGRIKECLCWVSVAHTDYICAVLEILSQGDDDVPRKMMLEDPVWPESILELVTANNQSEHNDYVLLADALWCLTVFDESLSPDQPYQLELLNNPSIPSYMNGNSTLLTNALDGLTAQGVKGPGYLLFVKNAITTLEDSLKTTKKVKTWALRIAYKECKTASCECYKVRQFLKDPERSRMIIRKHHPCVTHIRDALDMTPAGRGYKGSRVDMQNEGHSWCLVKKVQGVGSTTDIKGFREAADKKDVLERLRRIKEGLEAEKREREKAEKKGRKRGAEDKGTGKGKKARK